MNGGKKIDATRRQHDCGPLRRLGDQTIERGTVVAAVVGDDAVIGGQNDLTWILGHEGVAHEIEIGQTQGVV